MIQVFNIKTPANGYQSTEFIMEFMLGIVTAHTLYQNKDVLYLLNKINCQPSVCDKSIKRPSIFLRHMEFILGSVIFLFDCKS